MYFAKIYFSVSIIEVNIPPLRERGNDIIILAEHFLKQICQDWQLDPMQLSNTAKTHLLTGYYEGNVRELRNVMERAVTLCEGEIIRTEHIQGLRQQASNLDIDVESASISPNTPTQSSTSNQPELPKLGKSGLPQEGLEEYLAEIEKRLLIQALDATHWNRTLAAKKLGMTFRSLRYRLKKFELDSDEEE